MASQKYEEDLEKRSRALVRYEPPMLVEEYQEALEERSNQLQKTRETMQFNAEAIVRQETNKHTRIPSTEQPRDAQFCLDGFTEPLDDAPAQRPIEAPKQQLLLEAPESLPDAVESSSSTRPISNTSVAPRSRPPRPSIYPHQGRPPLQRTDMSSSMFSSQNASPSPSSNNTPSPSSRNTSPCSSAQGSPNTRTQSLCQRKRPKLHRFGSTLWPTDSRTTSASSSSRSTPTTKSKNASPCSSTQSSPSLSVPFSKEWTTQRGNSHPLQNATEPVTLNIEERGRHSMTLGRQRRCSAGEIGFFGNPNEGPEFPIPKVMSSVPQTLTVPNPDVEKGDVIREAGKVLVDWAITHVDGQLSRKPYPTLPPGPSSLRKVTKSDDLPIRSVRFAEPPQPPRSYYSYSASIDDTSSDELENGLYRVHSNWRPGSSRPKSPKFQLNWATSILTTGRWDEKSTDEEISYDKPASSDPTPKVSGWGFSSLLYLFRRSPKGTEPQSSISEPLNARSASSETRQPEDSECVEHVENLEEVSPLNEGKGVHKRSYPNHSSLNLNDIQVGEIIEDDIEEGRIENDEVEEGEIFEDRADGVRPHSDKGKGIDREEHPNHPSFHVNVAEVVEDDSEDGENVEDNKNGNHTEDIRPLGKGKGIDREEHPNHPSFHANVVESDENYSEGGEAVEDSEGIENVGDIRALHKGKGVDQEEHPPFQARHTLEDESDDDIEEAEDITMDFLREQQQTLIVASQSGEIPYLKESIAPTLKFHRALMRGEILQAATHQFLSTNQMVENQRNYIASQEEGSTENPGTPGAYIGETDNDSFSAEQYKRQDPHDEGMLALINQHDGNGDIEIANINQENKSINSSHLESESSVNTDHEVLPHLDQSMDIGKTSTGELTETYDISTEQLGFHFYGPTSNRIPVIFERQSWEKFKKHGLHGMDISTWGSNDIRWAYAYPPEELSWTIAGLIACAPRNEQTSEYLLELDLAETPDKGDSPGEPRDNYFNRNDPQDAKGEKKFTALTKGFRKRFQGWTRTRKVLSEQMKNDPRAAELQLEHLATVARLRSSLGLDSRILLSKHMLGYVCALLDDFGALPSPVEDPSPSSMGSAGLNSKPNLASSSMASSAEATPSPSSSAPVLSTPASSTPMSPAPASPAKASRTPLPFPPGPYERERERILKRKVSLTGMKERKKQKSEDSV
ncbi:hypothetical protein B0J14DRAFT_641533 [Halenospora varia]|nr:hypothetical protein B0J14DRAFT_641533 [Halenospora varia]